MAEKQLQKVLLVNTSNQDATVAYGDEHIVIPPRGNATNLELAKLKINELPKGVRHKMLDKE